MWKYFIISILLFWQAEPTFKTEVKHMEMPVELAQVVGKEYVLSIEGKDTNLLHEVFLLKNEEGKPLLYYADIVTPVCIDGLCKPMFIEIYWNLLGNYVGYGVHEAELLTKFDHEPFEEVDYKKLHDLLRNRNSILKRKKLDDLFDKELAAEEKITFKGKEVDAVTGATRAEIGNSVVKGALYSCFTIWHLVHGPVRKELETYTNAQYTPEMQDYFLDSEYEDYQFFAIKKMKAFPLLDKMGRVLKIFEEAQPMTRVYILKKLPTEFWSREDLSLPLYEKIPQFDINTRTELIKHIGAAGPKASWLVAEHIPHLSKNQLRAYLKILQEKPALMNESVKTHMQSIVKEGQYTYAYLLEDFLESGG